MPGDQYERITTTPPFDRELRTAVDTFSGVGDAGKLLALDATGRVAPVLIPAVSQPITVTTSEALAAGDWVNIFNSGGNLRVRKASASIWTGAASQYLPANGFVLSGVGSGSSADVYTSGINSLVSKESAGSFIAADRGSPLYLSYATAGAGALIAPTSHLDSAVQPASYRGVSMIQCLGYIVDVNTGTGKASVAFNPQEPYDKHSIRCTAAVTGSAAIPAYITLTVDLVIPGVYQVSCNINSAQTTGGAGDMYYTLTENINGGGATVIAQTSAPMGTATSGGVCNLSFRRPITAPGSYVYVLNQVVGVGRNTVLVSSLLTVQRTT